MTNITKLNTFESGNPSGTALTAGATGNTGGSAGDWLANVFAATGGAALFTSDAHDGSLAGLARLVASTGTTFGFRTAAAGVTDLYLKSYFKIDAFGSATLFLINANDFALSASGFSVRLSTTGVLSVYKRSVTTATLASMVTPVTTGVWYRLDCHFTAAGDWELRCYLASTASANNPWIMLSDPISGSGVATGLTFFDNITWGAQPSTGTATLDAVYDGIAYGTDWIGPVASSLARPLETIASVNMTSVGKAQHYSAAADGSDTSYSETGVLSGTASYVENRLTALTTGPVKFGSRVAADANPGVDCTIALMQGASVIATRTQNDIPTTPTTYEYTCSGGEEALITDRENLRVRTSFVV
jgi:hypothetical protein